MGRYFLSALMTGAVALLAVGGATLWIHEGVYESNPETSPLWLDDVKSRCRSLRYESSPETFPLRSPEAEPVETKQEVLLLPLVGTTLTHDVAQPPELSAEQAAKPGVNWPRFRGEQMDGIAHGSRPLLRRWPKQGPKVVWSKTLGEGHAGAAVRNGRVYVLDYDRENQRDVLRCFALDDGRELWNYSYPVRIKRNHGISRTIPVVTDRFLVGLGPKCHLFCIDPITGKEYWHVQDTVKEFGVKVPAWYAGQCPMIDKQGRLILGTGSKDSLLVAIDPKSGKPIKNWKAPNPHGWKMTHVSVVPMRFAGQDMFVYCGKGGVAGVAAEDGRLLWETTDWKINIATVPTPVPLPDGRIFCSGGYNSGAVMLQLKETPDKTITVETLYRLEPKQFGSEQHTPIFYKDHLFGVREYDEQLVCLDLDGNEVWASGSQNKFGIGPYMIADDMIWVLGDNGKLMVVEATPEAYRPIASAQVLDGHEAWAPMALADGFLLLRDLTQMVCLDVRKKKNP